MKEKVLYW